MAEIPKAYEPQAVEEKWYDFWLKENCFVADPASPKPAYSIVIPPPNVTGMLHMGHVLNNTIQDILPAIVQMVATEALERRGLETRLSIAAQNTPSEVFQFRSEERRVGKECRSRWSRYH